MSLNEPLSSLHLDEKLNEITSLMNCFNALTTTTTTAAVATTNEKLDINSNNNNFINNENYLQKTVVTAAATNSTASSTRADDDDEEEEEEDVDGRKEDEELLQDEEEKEEESKTKGYLCNICSHKLNEAKLLSCLHVFCKACLNDILISNTEYSLSPTDSLTNGDEPFFSGGYQQQQQIQHNHVSSSSSSSTTSSAPLAIASIVCPTCKQKTRLPYNGIDGLEDDYVMQNMLEELAIEEMSLRCTSCIDRGNAIARCIDCTDKYYLCQGCVKAHEFMKLFTNHRVISFQDLKSQFGAVLPVHRPLFCKLHSTEIMKVFCSACEIPICAECLISYHKNHPYERIVDGDLSHIEPLYKYVSTAKECIVKSQDKYQTLETCLADLQDQLDTTRGTIEETYQSYRAILERKKEEMLKELEEQHSQKELLIMEMHNSLDKSTNKLSDVISFSDRVLSHGNTMEVLLLRKHIQEQFKYLFQTLPEPNFCANFQFTTDRSLFEKAVDEFFGRFMSNQTELQEFNEQQFQKEQQRLQEQFHQQQSLKSAAAQYKNVNFNQSPTSTEQDWFSGSGSSVQNVINTGCMNGFTNNHNDNYDDQSPQSPTLTQPQDWLLNMKHSAAMNPFSVDTIQPALSPDSQSTWFLQQMNMSNLSKQANPAMLYNNLSNLQQQAPFHMKRSSSPPYHDPYNNLMATGLSNVTSRSHTPGAHVSSATSMMPMEDLFFASSTTMTSNINQLTRLIAPNGLPTPSAPVSTHSSSPPASDIGGTMNRYDGNGNLCPPIRNTKMAHMQVRVKFGELGPGKGSFNSPHGFCIGVDEDIVVSDTNNHRIQVFDKNGEYKFQFGVPGRDDGQLWFPRKVAVFKPAGKFVVCDRGNERSRMQIFNKNGHFLNKISIKFMDIVAGLAVTPGGEIVTVDSVSPTIFRIKETGELAKWYDCSEHMREPSDIAIWMEEYYVCDFKGHCVVVFHENGEFLRRIGGENITNFPNGIDVSDEGDVLVGDSHGNRFHVAVFSRDGTSFREYECPHVKVSRCCGLKITMEGYVVTLAKNNHHVLVLNTLFI